MQLTKTFLPNSAIFIEKKWVKNRFLGKKSIFVGKKMYHGIGEVDQGGSHQGSPHGSVSQDGSRRWAMLAGIPLRQLTAATAREVYQGGTPGEDSAWEYSCRKRRSNSHLQRVHDCAADSAANRASLQ